MIDNGQLVKCIKRVIVLCVWEIQVNVAMANAQPSFAGPMDVIEFIVLSMMDVFSVIIAQYKDKFVLIAHRESTG